MTQSGKSREGVHLLLALNILLRHRFLIAALTLLAGGAAFIFCKMITPVYTAEARLMPSGDARMSLKNMLLGNTAQSSFELGDRSAAMYYAEMLRGDLFFGPLARRRWSTGQSLLDIVPRRQARAGRDESAALGELKDRTLQVAYSRSAGIITVRCWTPDPVVSAELANALVDSLRDFLLRDVTSGTGSLLRRAERSVAEAADALMIAEQGLRDFRGRNRALVTPEQELMIDRLERRRAFQEQLFSQLESQVNLLRMSEFEQPKLIDVLDPAKPPMWKSWPRTKVIAGGAGLLGCLLGIMIACVRAGLESMARRHAAGYAEFERHLRSLNAVLPGIARLLPTDSRRRS